MSKLLGAAARPMPMTMQLEVKDKDPNYAYRWARREDQRVEYLKALGYEVCETKQGGDPKNPDGTRKFGSLVLMRTKREDHERRREQLDAYTEQMESAPRERFKQSAESSGVGTSDSSKTFRAPLNAVLNERD
jgi:hypothetical protein